MGKKHRIILVVLAILSLAVLGGIVGLLIAPAEPTYGGKTLSAWLAEYDWPNQVWPPKFDSPPDLAIKHIGANAFPEIIARLRYRDPLVKVKLFQFIRSHPHLHVPLPVLKQDKYNLQALGALCALSTDAKPLVPTLAEALDHMNAGTRHIGGLWLESLGSDAGAAVPALIQTLKNKNDNVRFLAVQTLSIVGCEQTNVVLPVLEQCLKDPDLSVRLLATNEFSREPWIELTAPGHPVFMIYR